MTDEEKEQFCLALRDLCKLFNYDTNEKASRTITNFLISGAVNVTLCYTSGSEECKKLFVAQCERIYNEIIETR